MDETTVKTAVGRKSCEKHHTGPASCHHLSVGLGTGFKLSLLFLIRT